MIRCHRPRLATHVLATIAWAVCTPAWAATLQGTAAHRERIALPPGAVFEAVLAEVSRADASEEGPIQALTGMFTYMADAATITLCADGRRLPVAMEADYKALEAAHLRARREAGQALLVSLEGRIAARPSAEEGRRPQTTLIVERFINVWPRESCGNPLADSPLRGTYWKLVRLGETPVQAAENQREPHLIFASDALRISGSGGCNRVMGNFELDGDKLHLGRMASTMMACPSGMEQEQQFLRSLEKVERYRISGGHLDMLDAAGALIARFEAVALR